MSSREYPLEIAFKTAPESSSHAIDIGNSWDVYAAEKELRIENATYQTWGNINRGKGETKQIICLILKVW